jgi:MHS family shikimate/dehydroshikimate transporter-like MFS transporter
MSRELFLNIGLLVGAVSCVTIPLFALSADRFGLKRVYVAGALVGLLSAVPFFLALEARSVLWIVVFSVLLANIAHDMVVSVQQPLFTELFGTEYRYSGAGVGYQFASVVCGGFTPFIATALLGVDGSWHAVAAYLAGGCLISLIVAARMKMAPAPAEVTRQRSDSKRTGT